MTFSSTTGLIAIGSLYRDTPPVTEGHFHPRNHDSLPRLGQPWFHMDDAECSDYFGPRSSDFVLL